MIKMSIIENITNELIQRAYDSDGRIPFLYTDRHGLTVDDCHSYIPANASSIRKRVQAISPRKNTTNRKLANIAMKRICHP